MTEKPTVLVIEDNPLDRKLLTALFEHEGFFVEHAEDGETAIRMISARASIILLDVMLPTLSGFDVAFWMQQNTPDLLDRLIVVTNVPAEVVQSALPEIMLIEKSDMVEQLRSLARNYLVAAGTYGVLGVPSA